MPQTITKTDAPTIDALRDFLAEEEIRIRDEYERSGDLHDRLTLGEIYDLTSLPIYGDLNPEDTSGIWSWDDSRVLLYDGDGRWSIIVAEDDNTRFEGWIDTGNYRVEDRGCGIYSIYERDDDAYVHAGKARADNAEDALDRFLSE